MGCSSPNSIEVVKDNVQELSELGQVLSLKYETDSDNENVLLIGNDTEGSTNDYISFLDGEKNYFELYYNGEIIKGPYYRFDKKGTHSIKLKLNKLIHDFSFMFYNCVKLKGIEGYINTSEANKFSWMFGNCSSLVDISGLRSFDVSNGEYFKYMFNGCTSLKDISPIKNWNVMKGIDFSGMFKNCKSLKNFKPIKSWDINKDGVMLEQMFDGCGFDDADDIK